jgi:hypothetical protein
LDIGVEYGIAYFGEQNFRKGMPDAIVSDRDSKFTSTVWTNPCEEIGIHVANNVIK